MLWKKLMEGRYWKLIDEKAHQSTEGIVASSPAHYDISRSAPPGFAPTIPLLENVICQTVIHKGTCVSITERFQILLLKHFLMPLR